jgi:hypothetical protein
VPTGTLVNANATATVAESTLSTSLGLWQPVRATRLCFPLTAWLRTPTT